MSTYYAIIDPVARTVTLQTRTGQRRAWARILADTPRPGGGRRLILDRRIHRWNDTVEGWVCAGGWATVMTVGGGR